MDSPQANKPEDYHLQAIYATVAHEEFEGEKAMQKSMEDLGDEIVRVLNHDNLPHQELRNRIAAWNFQRDFNNWLLTHSGPVAAQRAVQVQELIEESHEYYLHRGDSISKAIQFSLRLLNHVPPSEKKPGKISYHQVVKNFELFPFPIPTRKLFAGLFNASLDLFFFTAAGLLINGGEFENISKAQESETTRTIEKQSEIFGAYLIALNMFPPSIKTNSQKFQNMQVTAGFIQTKVGLVHEISLKDIA